MPSIPGLLTHLALPNTPKIIHWHADVSGTQIATRFPYLFWIYAKLEQELLRNARTIIATSEHYANASPSLQAHKKKIVIVPLGIPEEQIKTYTRHPKAPQHYFLALGRLAYYKGYEYAIAAMSQLQNSTIQLIIAGDGPERKKLEQLVAQKKLQSQVHFLGYVTEEEKHSLISHAHGIILPSIDRAEAFGVVLLEAMQHRKPLITTQVHGSGMNYVNQHQRTGIVVPPADSLALSHAMLTLFEDKELCQKYGNCGFNSFTELFTIRNIAMKITEVYAHALTAAEA
jgi:rhamnosyl/mannosyltransferase